MRRVFEAITGLNVSVGHVVRWFLVVMVGVGTVNALLRYASKLMQQNLSSNGLAELQWYLFAAVFLLGAPYTLHRDKHVRVDVLYGRLSERGRAVIDLAGSVLFLVPFCVFGLVVSWPEVVESFRIGEVSTDPGGLTRWPVQALVPISFGLLALQGLVQIRDAAGRLRGAP